MTLQEIVDFIQNSSQSEREELLENIRSLARDDN
jgi:hypothetical protein